MAQHRKLKMVYRSPDDLIPYENNPRLNDDTVPALKESIDEFDFLVPIIVNKEGVILSGHTRLKAAKEGKGVVLLKDGSWAHPTMHAHLA